VRHWQVSYLPAGEGPSVPAVFALVREVTADVRGQAIARAQREILEHLARGDSLADVLAMITRTVAACSVDGFLPSILLVEDGVRLRHAASLGLPRAYIAAIDGSAIGPEAGSCGTAVHRRARVVVQDILDDPLWDDFRHLAAPHNLRSCWSTPIIGSSGAVLGSFAMYYNEPRLPSPADVELVDLVVRTTGLVIELRRGEEERQRLLDSERTARQDAEAANRSKDDFVAMLSHELRTPLNAALGWISMLKTGAVRPGGEQRALDAIARSADAQARLVDDLLDVSRVVTGKLKVDLRPEDIAAVVSAACDMMRPTADARQQQFDCDQGQGGIIVLADVGRLKQVLCNLIANAIKFTQEHGTIRVSCGRMGAAVQIQILDNGAGIPPDLLPFIFDRFRQGERRGGRGEGLGLGLAIARHIVELHRGTIEAHSAGVGRGSTFRIMLPVVRPTA
jgi:signal transduction histidine kinase